MLRTQVSAKEKVKELKPVTLIVKRLVIVEDATHHTWYACSFVVTLGLKI